MKTVIIAAHDPNLVIGRDGKLPWNYPEDLKHFKKRTMGHPILMGRIVFEELNRKPLPGRKNIVLSRKYTFENVACHASIESAIDSLKNHDKLFVIGGAVVYRQFLPHADYLYITKIHQKYKGDTYFPEYRDDIGTVWEEIFREDHEEFSFIDYKRK